MEVGWRDAGCAVSQHSGRIVEDHMVTMVTHAIGSLQASQASDYKYRTTYAVYENMYLYMLQQFTSG